MEETRHTEKKGKGRRRGDKREEGRRYKGGKRCKRVLI